MTWVFRVLHWVDEGQEVAYKPDFWVELDCASSYCLCSVAETFDPTSESRLGAGGLEQDPAEMHPQTGIGASALELGSRVAIPQQS